MIGLVRPFLFLAAVAPSLASPELPVYEVALDEEKPLEALFLLRLPKGPTGPLRLAVRPGSPAIAPVCDRGALLALGERRWMAPPECSEIRWSVRLLDHDREGVDAAAPLGAWSGAGRWWLLTDRLPWLAAPAGPATRSIRIRARFGDAALQDMVEPMPGRDALPFYRIVTARDPAIYRRGGFALRLHGPAPAGADSRQLADVAAQWGRWRRDLLPRGIDGPTSLDMIWLRPPAGAEPGVSASAGAGAVLMQYAPGAASDRLRLAAAQYLIGGHEGFHAIIGAMPQHWPVWVNESWASYFAWRAARGKLKGAEMAAVEQLIRAPAAIGLLHGQRAYDKGDHAQTSLFYGKGALFWDAIEAVLVTRKGPSGRLAALIQDSQGFQGVDWSSAESIADFLDARSDGAARALVNCYLVQAICG